MGLMEKRVNEHNKRGFGTMWSAQLEVVTCFYT